MIDTPIIELSKIDFAYSGNETKVLDQLNLKIFSKDRIGMMAPNGSGKTTLLHTIMGLCRPDSGSIRIFGDLIEKESDFISVRSKIGLLFQDSDDQLFCPTVLDDVAFGPLNLGYSRNEAIKTAHNTLEKLGIEHLQDRITHRMSGGQKRLIALASVLAMKPEVLLLDEPTAGLDDKVKDKLIHILNTLDISYFVISHEFNFIKAVTDKIYSMEHGRILTDEQIHIHQHEHVHRYGRHAPAVGPLRSATRC